MVAFCTDIPEFQGGRILDADYASNFPGAAVIPVFADAVRRRGWDIFTGDQAIHSSKTDHLSVGEIFVVQEDDSVIGRELIAAGAVPALIINGESPLYAPNFYRNAAQVCDPFPHRVLFSGVHQAAGQSGINHSLLFPAFHSQKEALHTPWAGRKQLAIVASNKYWRHSNTPWAARIKRQVREFRDHDHTAWIKANQLHDRRLTLLSHFHALGTIDVYGAGWDQVGHLPVQHRGALTTLTPLSLPAGHQAKQQLLSSYRFTLALENFVYPGYVTEKIFDALVAGSIPVYLGAPDIQDFVPKEAFIDIRDFPDPIRLQMHLDELDEETGTAMVEAGRRFLESQVGQLHSFESRGEFFAEVVTQVIAGSI